MASLCVVACTAHAGVQVLNDDAHFPEGPVWYRGKLYYVEYDRNAVMTWDGKKNAVFSAERGCGQSAVVPTAHCGGIYFTASGHLGPVIDGKVFYIAAGGSITQVAIDLHNANGLAVSADGKILYVVETEDRRLLQFDIAADGSCRGAGYSSTSMR
jgi:sugar lactone lactonase YvrE